MSTPSKRRPLRIAVLHGGFSSEFEVSHRSGAMVMKNLPALYKTTAYDPSKELQRFIKDVMEKRVDLVFNCLHGRGGEDGSIQGLLEILGVPYTGSGVLASSLAMDKSMAKRIFLASGIPTPPGILITKLAWKKTSKELQKTLKKNLGPQVVIKPNTSGSSIGVSVKPLYAKWPGAVELALKEDGHSCLVETFRPGRELTVGVLGVHELQPLPVVEIRTKRTFFDYKAKYTEGGSEEICPAPIPPKVAEEAQALAVACHIALGCRGYSRTDIIWHKHGLDVLETNTLPGMTTASLLPLAAQTAGISFAELLVKMVNFALEKN